MYSFEFVLIFLKTVLLLKRLFVLYKRETCLIQRPNENKTYVYDDDISECVDLSEYN